MTKNRKEILEELVVDKLGLLNQQEQLIKRQKMALNDVLSKVSDNLSEEQFAALFRQAVTGTFQECEFEEKSGVFRIEVL